MPHGVNFLEMQVASIDHAIWFHRDLRVDEWMLYAIESPSASGARGFSRGAIFARDGSLVASVAQEGPDPRAQQLDPAGRTASLGSQRTPHVQ